MGTSGIGVPAGVNVYDAPYYDAQSISVGTAFPPCRGIYNPTASNNLTITMASGQSASWTSVPAGIIPIAATNITVAGTGTGLLALY